MPSPSSSPGLRWPPPCGLMSMESGNLKVNTMLTRSPENANTSSGEIDDADQSSVLSVEILRNVNGPQRSAELRELSRQMPRDTAFVPFLDGRHEIALGDSSKAILDITGNTIVVRHADPAKQHYCIEYCVTNNGTIFQNTFAPLGVPRHLEGYFSDPLDLSSALKAIGRAEDDRNYENPWGL